jgi:hypothetical protein
VASQNVVHIPPQARHALFASTALMKNRNIKIMKYLEVTEL